MKNNNQTIKCNVYDCRNCDYKHNICNLKEIKICNRNSNDEKESTMCNSYKRR